MKKLTKLITDYFSVKDNFFTQILGLGKRFSIYSKIRQFKAHCLACLKLQVHFFSQKSETLNTTWSKCSLAAKCTLGQKVWVQKLSLFSLHSLNQKILGPSGHYISYYQCKNLCIILLFYMINKTQENIFFTLTLMLKILFGTKVATQKLLFSHIFCIRYEYFFQYRH